jgi:hypothetical protein
MSRRWPFLMASTLFIAMRKRLVFRGERLLSSEGHSEMAEAYEKAAADPRLTNEKRHEYLEKARQARELANRARILEGSWLRGRARKGKWQVGQSDQGNSRA